jgi:hypothetical protein
VDKELGDFLSSLNMPLTFALPWILTWFSHSIDDIAVISRLFDILLVTPCPLFPVYVAAFVILSQRDQVLAKSDDYTDVHCYFQVLRIPYLLFLLSM